MCNASHSIKYPIINRSLLLIYRRSSQPIAIEPSLSIFGILRLDSPEYSGCLLSKTASPGRITHPIQERWISKMAPCLIILSKARISDHIFAPSYHRMNEILPDLDPIGLGPDPKVSMGSSVYVLSHKSSSPPLRKSGFFGLIQDCWAYGLRILFRIAGPNIWQLILSHQDKRNRT